MMINSCKYHRRRAEFIGNNQFQLIVAAEQGQRPQLLARLIGSKFDSWPSVMSSLEVASGLAIARGR